MNKDAYERLVHTIKDRVIYPPDDITVDELRNWINAYATCQHDILDVIENLRQDIMGC